MGSNVKITCDETIEAVAEMSEDVLIGEEKDRLPEEILIDFRMKNIFYTKFLSEPLIESDYKYINHNALDNVIDDTNVGMDITILDVWHWGDLHLDNLIIKHMLKVR